MTANLPGDFDVEMFKQAQATRRKKDRKRPLLICDKLKHEHLRARAQALTYRFKFKTKNAENRIYDVLKRTVVWQPVEVGREPLTEDEYSSEMAKYLLFDAAKFGPSLFDLCLYEKPDDALSFFELV